MYIHLDYLTKYLTLQRASYIEDGWYIVWNESTWNVFEIPLYGGQEELIGSYNTFQQAYSKAKTLI